MASPAAELNLDQTMPLYEYECPRTGKRFEVIQKFSDPPITRCDECDQHPDCDGEARKLLSAPAIQFKGTGWYVTDYGKGGQKPKTESESGPSKKSDKSESKKDSTKSESKKSDSKKS